MVVVGLDAAGVGGLKLGAGQVVVLPLLEAVEQELQLTGAGPSWNG